MKRWTQKLLSVLMSLALVLSLGATAFANDDEEATDNSGSSPEEIQAELERQRQAELERQRQAEQERRRLAELEEQQEDKQDSDNQDIDDKDTVDQDIIDLDVDDLDVDDLDVDDLDVDDLDVDDLDVDDLDVDDLDVDDLDVDDLDVDDQDADDQDADDQDVLNQDADNKQDNDNQNDSLSKEQKTRMNINKSKASVSTDEDDAQPLFQPDSIRQDDILKFQADLAEINAMSDENSDEDNQGKRTILLAKGATDKDVAEVSTGTVVQKQGKTVIEVDGKTYTKDKDVDYEEIPTDAGTPDEGLGWSASDGTLSITENTINELIVKEGDLTIQAAGLNHINKLVTNNVVNIIGTGILLLDDYDLKDSGEVKLTENLMYYEDTGVKGSVAVFLKDKDASTSDNYIYRLINNGIDAIWDGSYTIASKYNLIISSGESVIVNSTVAVPDSDSKTGYKYYSGTDVPDLENTIENSASVKIAKGASLTVEKGASIEMKGTNSAENPGMVLTPMITVADGGKLGIDGLLKGSGLIVASDESDVDYTETGDGPMVTVKGSGAVQALLGELWNMNIRPGDDIYYNDLLQAWNNITGDPHTSEQVGGFVITVYGASEEDTHQVVITKAGETIAFPASSSEWGVIGGSPYTGIGLGKHDPTATGSGLLVDPTFRFPTGSSKVILTAEKPVLWRVIVTENPKRGTWTLSVWYGDTQIFDLGVTTVRARFQFDKPDDWDTKNIYVVFIDKDGKSLKAFPATYDTVTGELVFDSSLVGEFVVVQFDYQGELYSKGFYDELAKLDAVQHLVDLHNGKAN